jgi:glycerol uptake facilitator-like aquaporin
MQGTCNEIIKRVHVCHEPSCVHHNPARALGDLIGIKKHFCWTGVLRNMLFNLIGKLFAKCVVLQWNTNVTVE